VAEEHLMCLTRHECADPTWSWGLEQYHSFYQKDMTSSSSPFILGNLLGINVLRKYRLVTLVVEKNNWC